MNNANIPPEIARMLAADAAQQGGRPAPAASPFAELAARTHNAIEIASRAETAKLSVYAGLLQGLTDENADLRRQIAERDGTIARLEEQLTAAKGDRSS